MGNKCVKVGIGFATGRKSFQRVLKTYIQNWNDSGLLDNDRISLNVLVSYDLSYQKTRATDFTNVPAYLSGQIDDILFISSSMIRNEIEKLTDRQILTPAEARLIFGKGYASKRNAVLYFAIRNKMDCLVFLDDDEYPMAVTNTRKTALWSGQHVISSHLSAIRHADITHGNHCGYISPIPYIEYNDRMTEDDFRGFIEAISNDIIEWDKIKAVMENGGVTYADTQVLINNQAVEVPEIHHAKFISGANLCINLKVPTRVFPFYNPPGARGEDTFLSTCLHDRKVMRVPCYAFHDGFGTYNYLLDGVLPTTLKSIRADNEDNIARFYRASIGWIRYKPLLLYITEPENYGRKIEEMKQRLETVLPRVADYFGHPEFLNIRDELTKYDKNVRKHYQDFEETKAVWARLMKHLQES